jgi:hypothetical protein
MGGSRFGGFPKIFASMILGKDIQSKSTAKFIGLKNFINQVEMDHRSKRHF